MTGRCGRCGGYGILLRSLNRDVQQVEACPQCNPPAGPDMYVMHGHTERPGAALIGKHSHSTEYGGHGADGDHDGVEVIFWAEHHRRYRNAQEPAP